MKDTKIYELVGTFNFLDFYPDKIFPVFKDENGQYYGAYSGYSSPYIDSFYPFPGTDIEKKIRFIDKEKDILEDIDFFYEEGSILIVALECQDNEIYIGSLEKARLYIKEKRRWIASKIDYLDDEAKEDAKIFLRFFDDLLGDINRKINTLDYDRKKAKVKRKNTG